MRRAALLGLAWPALLAAQGVRITGVTSTQLIELRRLVLDSADASTIAGTGEWRTTAEGVPALCPATSAFCTFERSGERVSAAPVLQDLTIAAWGWREGFSMHANVRARGQLWSREGFMYPRANDRFDALEAYAELDRSAWRARLGRQWITGGLGAYVFDGGNALLRRDAFSLEGWGGRALVAGLAEPYTSEQLAAVDNLPPPENGYVFGGRARYRPNPLAAAAVMYQRVILADRSGLYSERASLDASTRQFSAVAVDLGLNYDFSTGAWNEARLRVGTGLGRTLGYSLEVRHSRPFFELWTIWGAFAPVGFDEERATVNWMPRGSPFSLALRGAYRTYADADAGFTLRTNGWRAGGDVAWQGASPLSAFGSYDVDIGSGAASTDVRTGVRWSATDAYALGADLSVTQNIYEYRVGTGRIYGAGLDGSVRLAPDVRLVLGAALYQHTLTNGAPGPDWTQRRAAARFEWTVGRDPGMPAGSAP